MFWIFEHLVNQLPKFGQLKFVSEPAMSHVDTAAIQRMIETERGLMESSVAGLTVRLRETQELVKVRRLRVNI